MEGDKPKRSKFKRYPIGFFHIDIAEVQTAEGKLYLFVGIDRTSKFAVTQLADKVDRKTAWEFLQHMLEAVPYSVHTILTDNGIQFAEWVVSVGLEPSAYGTHSMRRTKVAQIYKKTGNLGAVQLLLGHTKMDSTVRYLGVDIEDALTLSEGIDL